MVVSTVHIGFILNSDNLLHFYGVVTNQQGSDEVVASALVACLNVEA